jgi:hypothetical protein
MNRGLYGQNEGNEKRDGLAQLVDQLADNEICEGHVVDPMRALWHMGAWQSMDDFIAEIKGEWLERGPDPDDDEYPAWAGAVHTRINSIITRATYETPNFFLFAEGDTLGGAGAAIKLVPELDK